MEKRDEFKDVNVGISKELADFRKSHYSDIGYSLRFIIPEKKQERIYGTVSIAFRSAINQLPVLDFRGETDQILSVLLDSASVAYEVRQEHIIIPQEIEKGSHTIEISFMCADQSLNRRDDFLYTLLVPDRAHTLFPCMDQPNMKALFDLSLEIPKDWKAVSNGKLLAEKQIDTVRKELFFAQTEPLSTYLFSFVAGVLEQEHFERGGRSIFIYHKEKDLKKKAQCPEIAREVFDALDWLENYTAIPYPFAKYDLVILPGFQYGGMEHTGATLYTDRRMFLNEQFTLNEQMERSALIAHETAHMWFGDLVTMDWFSGVWIKEVMANYFASQIIEPQYPSVNHRLHFMLNYYPAAYSEDRTEGTNAIQQDLGNLRDAGLIYGKIIYNKSPIVMDMLIRKIGDKSFQQGIRTYLKKYAYGNASWDDLIAILDDYTSDDLNQWSRTWVHEKGMPTISYSEQQHSLTVRQVDPCNRGLCWSQTLSFQLYSKEMKKEADTIAFNMKGKEISLNIDSLRQQVVLPNVDGCGYGFFCLNETIAQNAMTRLYKSDDEVERGSLQIMLYENLWHQTVRPDWFSEEMTNYLQRETNILLYSSALRYIASALQLFPTVNREKTEQMLWNIVCLDTNAQRGLLAFRCYQSIAQSETAMNRLYRIWNRQDVLRHITLSESDDISLSYLLAIKKPQLYDEIVEKQKQRLIHSTRWDEYCFIAPFTSPRKEERDSLFQMLLHAENRRIEPWVATALSLLNHPDRQKEAIEYIRPALEELQEVQYTGDIFFPTNWLSALLAGHHSAIAQGEVQQFLEAYPNYPSLLKNKILQQAHHLTLELE